MLLDGNEVVGYIKERQLRQVRSLAVKPRLAIVRQGATAATDSFLRVKQAYGEDIGVAVDVYTEAPEELLNRIKTLNQDAAVTGIIVQLPFADDPELCDKALDAVAVAKDVDGLAPGSHFEPATPKAIRWLLSAYNVDLKGKVIAVVGQGRLVGRPLAEQFEASGYDVRRLDDGVADLATSLREADVIISATGQPGLIASAMVKAGTVVVDVGAPRSELTDDLRTRDDIKMTPNPGGVGPVTVAALFDNVLFGASSRP